MNPTILIAEDHSVVRLGTIMLLQEMYPAATLEEAPDFNSVVRKLDTLTFDLVILDIHIPGGDNLKMVEIIKLRQPDIRILIFSGYDEKVFAPNYIRAGALGYLQKDADRETFKYAVNRVLLDKLYFSDEIQKVLYNNWAQENGPAGGRISRLSARELEVMNLLVKGYSVSKIKTILNIQPSTISTHKEKIFSKLNVSNVIELAQVVTQEMETNTSAL